METSSLLTPMFFRGDLTRFQESDPAHDFVHQYESVACTTRDGGALVS